MSTQAARLARLFTPEYARRVNAQIVHPAESVVVKPNELESGLSRPLHVAAYEPDRPAAYLAATLSYGIIMGTSFSAITLLVDTHQFPGHPFQDGNKRTGSRLSYTLSACIRTSFYRVLPCK
jgi:prophage maintenance system killer protein